MTEGKLSPAERRYARINALWPLPLPALTEQEAISAAKRLYRIGAGKAYKGTFRIGTGNRHTWARRGVFTINASKGWHDLVHSISHLTHYHAHPDKPGHAATHPEYERKLIEAVLAKGWLTGSLRRPEKAKPDLSAVRYQRVLARIKNWETKRTRAETALTKLNVTRRYYERKLEEGR
jgi:hypothetical protein